MDHEYAAAQFRPDDRILSVEEHGSGNVNDTYLVTLDSDQEKHFILQRINQHVFSRPDLIILNIRTFTEHVRHRLQDEPPRAGGRWEVPYIMPTPDGMPYWIDPSGECWRAMSFVAHSTGYTTVQSIDHAREAGYALGRFHSLISDLPVDRLHDTLEGFHITPRYLKHYDRVLSNGADRSSLEAERCLSFVGDRRSWVSVLEDASARGELPLRPIHGDPKVDNIMIDDTSGQAVSIVDLDTVKPGLIHYDIGDCLRSCCNPLGEETDRIDQVQFETDLCQAILEGYLSEANRFLSECDYAYLYDAIRLIAFELGLRFFTDFLQGNVYFKAKHREHNLQRALVQFKLAESIESQEGAIRTIIADQRGKPGS